MKPEFLRRAVCLSRSGMENMEGGPFGAVVVKDGKIIAEGNNQVTSHHDPTAHAEIVAIRRACLSLGTFSLEGCEVYASCEPCPMCLAALYWSGIRVLYYANTAAQAAEAGFDDAWIYHELALSKEERSLRSKHVPDKEAQDVFRSWRKNIKYTRY
jgi:guanine deaminase